MDSSDWEKLQRVFHAALALPENEREAYISTQTLSEALAGEVRAMLAAQSRPDPVIGVVDEIAADTQIGSYRVIEAIGEGGMGSVYLAERADGAFEKQVAIKVLSQGMNRASMVQRFEQERAILARLSHPNIAGVLDGGMTEDGRPYVVMEYIQGSPITQYCDERSLNLRERLRLFQQVCDAVQYAHQSLVVHRDLKPTNIFVTEEGTPKLLDFGIAKLLEDDDPLHTQTGLMLATPAYAAPEQLTGGNITTMTDVYALGVLLYELLTGRRPFEPRRTPEEYWSMILNTEPLKPSTAVTQQPMPETERTTTSDGETASVANARGTQITRLRSQLRGDLDNICIMAIMREPGLRYATAAALGEDISRHLEGKPVQARAQSFAYRAKKFYARNRASVVLSSLAIALLAGFAIYHTNRIAKERDLAIEERQKTEEVVQFVTGLFEAADPGQARGAETTARQLLDAGLRQIETQMLDRPAVQASLKQVLGRVYYEIGLQEEAQRLLEEALRTNNTLYGENHAETARTWFMLGNVHQTVGNFDEAHESFENALRIQRAIHDDLHSDVVETIGAQGFLEETIGNYANAETRYNSALDAARKLAGGDETLLVAQQLAKLGGLSLLQDRLEKSEQLMRNALEVQERLYGGAHPESDETKRQLAEVLTKLKKHDEAEQLFKELIDSRTRMLGEDHYETGAAWNSFGHLLVAKGDLQAGVEAYQKMLTITERAYGDTHPSLAAGYHNIATLQRDLDNLPGAVEGFKRSLKMMDSVGMADDHPNRAYPLAGLGRVLLLQRNFIEAAQVIERALEIRRAVLDEGHVLIAELLGDIGAIYTELGRFDEAEPALLASYNHFFERYGLDDSRTGLMAGRLVRHYDLTDRSELAEPYLEQAPAQNDERMLQYY